MHLLKYIPWIGRFVIRYERALIMIANEGLNDSREDIISGLDDDKWWSNRRDFESRLDAPSWRAGRVDWKKFPNA